tara:strand:- start:3427 stop:3729 length:303 start_codon:yes stop_codon:yes gene_type:complete
MIKFPATLTPVPKLPGYFWDVESHKLYSIKVGGVLRELKMQYVNRYTTQYRRFSKFRQGEKHYSLSKEGRTHIMLVRDLKKLTLVDYTMPVIDYTVKEVA